MGISTTKKSINSPRTFVRSPPPQAPVLQPLILLPIASPATPTSETSTPKSKTKRIRVKKTKNMKEGKRSAEKMAEGGDTMPETEERTKKKPRKAKKDKSKPVEQQEKKPNNKVAKMITSDLFVMDSTPSAVPAGLSYVMAAMESPSKPSTSNEILEVHEVQVDLVEEVVVTRTEENDEDEAMRIFASEVMDTDEEEEDDEDEDDDEEEMIFDDPKTLQRAIQGKITDDSAAKVTGRYYKEVDLTRSCSLCGEQGHTSRECTHSQCFTCGIVDGDHEARNCPVSLICGACGARGHFSRDCHDAGAGRSAFGARCGTCSSSNHYTTNCPTLWRVYDTQGARPNKSKIIFACANDGSTADHFVDDCLAPRMHPLRYVDASAFNRLALPSESRPAAAALRILGQGAGSDASARRRGGGNREEERQEVEDDDDWFASRNKGPAVQRHSGTGSKKDRYASMTSDSSRSNSPRDSPYGGGGRFSRQNRDLKESGGSNRGRGSSQSNHSTSSSAHQSGHRHRDNEFPPHLSRSNGPNHSSSSKNKQTQIKFSGGDNQARFKGSPAPSRDSGRRGEQELNYGSGGDPRSGSGRDSRQRGGSLASRVDRGPTYNGGYY